MDATQVHINYDDTDANVNGVNNKQWKRWSVMQRRVFNNVYTAMADQWAFSHPCAVPAAPEHWNTTRWNAAWIAADIFNVVQYV